MFNKARHLTLPLVAALTFAVAPAQAVSIGAGGASAGGAAPSTQAQTLTKKQLKQQRKLQRQCAKYAAGQIKKASKRATLANLCKVAEAAPEPAAPNKPPATGGGTTGPGSSTQGIGNGVGGGSGQSQSQGGSGTLIGGISNAPALFPSVSVVDVPSSNGPMPAGLAAPTSVPEPGSLALLGLGLAGLGFARRRMSR